MYLFIFVVVVTFRWNVKNLLQQKGLTNCKIIPLNALCATGFCKWSPRRAMTARPVVPDSQAVC